jgi:uncharacterized membrane protein YidH (DUF202 family)
VAVTAHDGDPGLQGERTYLAWQRTIALFLVVALLSLADIWELGRDVHLDVHLAPVGLLAVAAAVLAVGLRRRWRGTGNGRVVADSGRGGAPLGRPWMVVLTSTVVTVFGLTVAATVMVWS